ncbi:MAG TPA: LacI family DNA-binding transcriptional regulator, partial [Anaerovoracaceae bacterium]|nr:LacI family DNA-binding transcriptional regulator [Anaerovoracaceae bacterium]
MKIKDIASMTGLSVATISRVMNNHPNVAPETREKVENAISETGYVPNFLGRNLRVSKTHKILIMLPNAGNPFYAEILEAIQEEANHSEYTILIGVTNEDPNLETKYMEMLTTKQVDGAITFLSKYDKYSLSQWASRYPLVQCCEYTDGAQITNISVDNEQGAFDAVSYLIRKGHTKIGAVRGQLYFASESDRTAGYKRALAQAGIEYRDEYCHVSDYTPEGGFRGAKALMALEDPPTAIFAYGDTIAIGAIKALSDMGKIIVGRKDGERNVAVIGFDDIQLSGMLTPTISSVYQPK